MGLRAIVFVCATCFLLGALFTHWIADSLTLWKSPVTDEHLWTAATYYSILAQSKEHMLYILGAVVALGATTVLWSLNDLQAGNIMFDGGSIFLFTTTVVMYFNSVLPTILSQFSSLPPHQVADPFPAPLKSTTLELASNHLVCSVALTGVLALQAGRYFSEKADQDDETDNGEYVMVDATDAEDCPAEDAVSSTSVNVSRAKTPDCDAHLVKPFRLETTN